MNLSKKKKIDENKRNDEKIKCGMNRNKDKQRHKQILTTTRKDFFREFFNCLNYIY